MFLAPAPLNLDDRAQKPLNLGSEVTFSPQDTLGYPRGGGEFLVRTGVWISQCAVSQMAWQPRDQAA